MFAAAATQALAPSTAATSTSELVPVFVDATGQRRRLIRRAAIALLAVVCAYGIAVVLSFLGGPVPPNALLPLPDAPNAASSGAPASPGNATPTPHGGGNATHAGSGNTGVAPALGRAGASSPSPSASPSASASPASGRRVPPGHVGRSASPGPSNGHGH